MTGIIIQVVPSSSEGNKRLTFSYSVSSLKGHKTTLQNPQELQYHRKPQEGLPKETHERKDILFRKLERSKYQRDHFP